ncbi:phosphoribosylformylglycinamidine synthase I [Spirochaetota bacterium]
MAKPKTIVLTGYGINCDEETKYAFERAGSHADIVHINDLIDSPGKLDNYEIFSFPGGFSYGDDTGSGKALANRIMNNLIDELRGFLERDTLMLGICNGFQVMVNIGVIPSLVKSIGEAEAALVHNKTFRYQCRWVDLKINDKSKSVFTSGIESLHIPVAHGEGNFFAPGDILEEIEKENLVTMRYTKTDGTHAAGEFPFNPNGSLNDIASICDSSGRIMGMMPHPERAILFSQRDDWTYLREKMERDGKKIPEESEGMKIFTNAVDYFS